MTQTGINDDQCNVRRQSFLAFKEKKTISSTLKFIKKQQKPRRNDEQNIL